MALIERLELLLIGVVAGLLWFFISLFPAYISAGRLTLFISALILSQSLIRDLSILFIHRKTQQTLNNTTKKVASCMCVESTVGITGIVFGTVLLSTSVIEPFFLKSSTWFFICIFTLLIGFVMKNYVIQWRPWKILKEKDHMNIIFTWKK